MIFREIKRVLLLTLFLNWAVAFAKIFLGLSSGTLCILSDGIHSLFDGATNVVGIFGIKIAEKPADKDHPYGHRKYEAIASQVILIFLIIAAWEIIRDIIGKFSSSAAIHSDWFPLSLGVLISCLIIDVLVARYEFKKGVELKSTILKADAMHAKSHYITTGAVILGTVLIKIGLPPIIDPIIASFVVVFIGKLAFAIFKETSSVLSDKALLDGEKIKKIVESINGVKSCHQIRTRGDESHIFLDIHIIVAPELPLIKAHEICDEISGEIQKAIPEIKDVTVHPEPN
ncbi:MAG: cation diffusion facilitator family transporter [bacterium]|nr:cation diffusion facilitator family transporter [bacterium]